MILINIKFEKKKMSQPKKASSFLTMNIDFNFYYATTPNFSLTLGEPLSN